jgi:large-conductance mechanosensitive channel
MVWLILTAPLSWSVFAITYSQVRSEAVKLIAIAFSVTTYFLSIMATRARTERNVRQLREALKDQNEELFKSIRNDAVHKAESINVGGQR